MGIFRRISTGVRKIIGLGDRRPSPEHSPGSMHNLRHRRSMSPAARVLDWQVQSPADEPFSPHAPTIQTWTSDMISPLVIAAANRNKRKRESPLEDEDEPRPKKHATGTSKTVQFQETQSVSEISVIDLEADLEDDVVKPSPLESEYSPSMRSEIVLGVDSPSSKSSRQLRSHEHDTNGEVDQTEAMEEDPLSSPLSSIATPITPASSPQRANNPNSTPITAPSTTPQSTVKPTSDLDKYPPSARPLALHLLNRGHEPILPSHWTLDYKFLPTTLFCRPHEQPLLTSLSGADFHAQRAFSALLALGARTRDLRAVKKRPERAARRAIRQHLAWALRDAGISPDLPSLVAFHHGGRAADLARLQRRLAAKMLKLHDAWAGEEVVYGVVVTGAALAIVCFGGEVEGDDKPARVAKVEAGLKLIGVFDLASARLDVWNALAVALLVAHVRDAARAHS